ncbi:SGNH/GDSL hydrolase family protein [soil metagenome]
MTAGCAYVALGSSFAAGPGLWPRAAHSPLGSGRSSINYPHLIARQLGLALDDRSFSGATIAQIAGVDPPRRGVPQVEAVGAGTRLVTLTAGGNDVGYIKRLTLTSLPRPLKVRRVRERIEALGEPHAVEPAFERLRVNLETLIREIRARSDAVIVATDYLTVLPYCGYVAGLPYEITHGERELAERISSTLSSIVQQSGAIFIPAAEASAAHHAWSDEPWTRAFHLGLRGGAPYHPTAAGMRAVAHLILPAVDHLGLES